MLNSLPRELHCAVATYCDEPSLRALEDVDHRNRDISIHEQMRRYGTQLTMLNPNLAYAYKKDTGNHLAPLRAAQNGKGGHLMTVADRGAWKRSIAGTLLAAWGAPVFNSAVLSVLEPGEIARHISRSNIGLPLYSLSYGMILSNGFNNRSSLGDRLAAQLYQPAPNGPYCTVALAVTAYACHMLVAYGASRMGGLVGVLGEIAMLFGVPSLLGGAHLGIEVDEERMPATQGQQRRALHNLFVLRDHMHLLAQQGHGYQAARLARLGIDPAMPDADGRKAADKALAAGHTEAARILSEVRKCERPIADERRDKRYRNYNERLMMAGMFVFVFSTVVPLTVYFADADSSESKPIS